VKKSIIVKGANAWLNLASCATAVFLISSLGRGVATAQPPQSVVIINAASGAAGIAPSSIASVCVAIT
jgi:hypothetical protein